MQRIRSNLAIIQAEQLLTIADNFDRRAKDAMDHYSHAHARWKKEGRYYEKMIARYSTWREAAKVLRSIAEGQISIDDIRKATIR